ncbi:uncharacterized protein C8R40DRAFT_1167746 [Lentinula edodes]|uniref:uncharacterized protein n=1 Tax=Lentinula edodes TaxID=5353 RepID=UPI001E8DF9D7|nr:uncharacterized protein C8R40DRAFT_1167746 [Lentinula edodes]KAH7878321.1 hypothetical protein C8R40DRAFT_1167746 [Lentinula edodes]KAJ3911811.1 hypothetical protein F5877DRAFT_85522 [Lentinula edodes]
MDHLVPVIHNQDDEPSGSWSNVHSESLPEGSDGPPPLTFIDNHSSECFEDHGALLRPCTTSGQFVFELGWFVLSKLVPMPSDREKILMPVKGYISHSGDVPSPIEKPPPEIMLEIFQFYISCNIRCEPWTDHSLQIFGLLSASRRPCLMVGCPALQLAKVCSSWRKTVLGNSSLWSSLYIETESLNTYPQLASLVKLYIVYSRSAPLTFFIRTQAEATHEMNQTLNLLIENSKRWKSAKIDIADSGFTPNFLLSRSLKNTCGILELSVPTPNLEDLEIDNHNWRNTACKIFPVCPRLKKFTANHLSWGPAFTGHNFFELVELHMGSDGGLFGPSIAHFLLGMPSLQTASIAKFCKTDDVAAELTSPHESSVTSLRIWTGTFQCPTAWRGLEFPQLKTLEVFHPATTIDLEYTCFTSILHSASSLQVLELKCLPEEMAVAFLAACPSISTLSLLLQYPDGTELLKRMMLGLTEYPIASKLSSLIIRVSTLNYRFLQMPGSHLRLRQFRTQLSETLRLLLKSRSASLQSGLHCSSYHLEHFVLDVTDVDEGREEAWSKLSLLAPGFKTFKIIRRRFRVGNEWTSESLQSALEM